MAEPFFSALKNEHVYRTVNATKAQARRDVIAYIEGFYNSTHGDVIQRWATGDRTRSTTVTPSRQRQRRETINPLSEIAAAGQPSHTQQFVDHASQAPRRAR